MGSWQITVGALLRWSLILHPRGIVIDGRSVC